MLLLSRKDTQMARNRCKLRWPLTTAAVLATSRGEFSLAIAFGIVLLAIAFAVNLAVTIVQQRQTVRR